ncbi:MAG: glutathionylspermidine synthase family protein [Gemmataceae bacterium]|nr:glutathionylspermidine synthase family protein [Gemmataceae bacterium]
MLPADFAQVRRRAVFDCCKWDPQVEDTASLAALPLVLRQEAWAELVLLAEKLARETLAAEEELLGRLDLHGRLGLPRQAARALASANRGRRSPGVARLIRFDFHHTSEGWRISEANTDVPGGLNEASGFTQLVAQHYPETCTVGDPAGTYAQSLRDALGAGARVALVHATAYSDDHQMMAYLARRLDVAGIHAHLVSPAHVRWRSGHAYLATDWSREPMAGLVRFFPAEWLPNLPAACGWTGFFHGSQTPISNPATAVLTQSKRFPLVWDMLGTSLPMWQALLPETCDPRHCAWRSEEWLVKPALGRVGDGVGFRDTMTVREWERIARDVERHPRCWVAQRRFEATPFTTPCGPCYPCIGVYTVDTRVVGAYGRMARRPLVDWRAQDIAVLVAGENHDLDAVGRQVGRQER